MQSGLAGGRSKKELTTPLHCQIIAIPANFAQGGKAYFVLPMEWRRGLRFLPEAAYAKPLSAATATVHGTIRNLLFTSTLASAERK